MGGNKPVACPASGCEFEGTLRRVVHHISKENDSNHTWDAIGYQNSWKFRQAHSQANATDSSTTTEDTNSSAGSDTPSQAIKLQDVPGIGKARADALSATGYPDAVAVAETPISELSRVSGISKSAARCVHETAREVCGYTDTYMNGLATELGADREEVALMYATLASTGVTPTEAETTLRLVYEPDNTDSVVQLTDYSIRYRHYLLESGLRTIKDVARASIDEITNASYVGETLADNIRSQARQQATGDVQTSDTDRIVNSKAELEDGPNQRLGPPTTNSRDPLSPPPIEGWKEVEPEIIDMSGTSTTDSVSGPSRSDTVSSGVQQIQIDSLDRQWTPYFRYESVYQDQIQAIDTFVQTLTQGGYYVFEGACGTGKTLAAITGGLHAIRDRDDLSDSTDTEIPEFSRLLVVTPLKQQLRQFVTELRGINASLPDDRDPVTTVVIRGKSDMMPYAHVELSPFDRQSIHEKADDLREMTRKVVKFGSNIPLDWPASMSPPEYSKHDYDWNDPSVEAQLKKEQSPYDPVRAEALTQIVESLTHSGGQEYDRLVVEGVETPYPELVPHTNDIVDTAILKRRGTGQLPVDLQGHFDPFYAGIIASSGTIPFPFSTAEGHVFDRKAMFREGASRGLCPHEAMGILAEEAEVVLGNYYHLFDPSTRHLTDDKLGLLDSETIIAVDEAHQIEERVRDMLSATVDIYTLNKAIKDVEIVRQYAIGQVEETPTPSLDEPDRIKAKSLIKEGLKVAPGHGVSIDDLREVELFLRFAKQRLGAYGGDAIAEKYTSCTWKEALQRWGGNELENALSDPENPKKPDTFFEDALAQDEFDEGTYSRCQSVMIAISATYKLLSEDGICDRSPQGVEVGTFFKRWGQESHHQYHREVILEISRKETIPTEFPEWVEGWTPKFRLYNCIPHDALQDVFSELGGGVLMSASLQPRDVFVEAVGVAGISYPSEEDIRESGDSDTMSDSPAPAKPDSDDDNSDVRPTAFDQFPLRFPQENRVSLIADLPKFTSKNRGPTVLARDQMTIVRKQYADFIESVASRRGNVLVAMPNYNEARWAHDYLKDRIATKRFHLDQSSSSLETDDTLTAFFADGEALLFTSSRSTVTEGVDYDGDKLHGCVVVGLPLLPTNSKRIDATIKAYDDRVRSISGFDAALTVPAVRIVRQAIGRVIRGSNETGFRILADSRYTSTGWASVSGYLSDQEQVEFQTLPPEEIPQALQVFWEDLGGGDPADIRTDAVADESGGSTNSASSRIDSTDSSVPDTESQENKLLTPEEFLEHLDSRNS